MRRDERGLEKRNWNGSRATELDEVSDGGTPRESRGRKRSITLTLVCISAYLAIN